MDRVVNELYAAQAEVHILTRPSPPLLNSVSAAVPLVYWRGIPRDMEPEYLEALRVRSCSYLPLALLGLSSFQYTDPKYT